MAIGGSDSGVLLQFLHPFASRMGPNREGKPQMSKNKQNKQTLGQDVQTRVLSPLPLAINNNSNSVFHEFGLIVNFDQFQAKP